MASPMGNGLPADHKVDKVAQFWEHFLCCWYLQTEKEINLYEFHTDILKFD